MENEEYDFKKPSHCPVVDINGKIDTGKQFDLDITLQKDNRNVIFGTIKDAKREPVKNAVVKLIEIKCEKDGMKMRIPISHTFTDEYGEFVFGPLCPDKEYAIDIWVNDVKHFRLCNKVEHEFECLKGKKPEECGCIKPHCEK